jgi:hypothetical protein
MKFAIKVTVFWICGGIGRFRSSQVTGGAGKQYLQRNQNLTPRREVEHLGNSERRLTKNDRTQKHDGRQLLTRDCNKEQIVILYFTMLKYYNLFLFSIRMF